MVPRSARRAPGKPPAVLIVHGSAGVDTRGPLMANALLQVGIATFEIDMWTPRRLRDGVNSVPRPAIETLPDAFGALKFLSSFPLIDPARIGITGFSLGGAVSMLTASKPLADQYGPPGLRFRAHAPLYPVCWAYNSPQRPQYVFKELTGAPVLIQGEVSWTPMTSRTPARSSWSPFPTPLGSSCDSRCTPAPRISSMPRSPSTYSRPLRPIWGEAARSGWSRILRPRRWRGRQRHGSSSRCSA